MINKLIDKIMMIVCNAFVPVSLLYVLYIYGFFG